MSRTRLFWILVGICIAGVLLRSYHLIDRSIWFDEAFSWRMIQFPFSEMIARDATDVHPPLYYILLKGWAYVFGSSVLALRSFSITASVLSLLSAYLFTAYAFRSKRAGLIAASLLAVSPWAISFAWEARMYTLGMVFALVSSYALLKATRTSSLLWFGIYGVLAACFAYTHYFALFTILAQAVFVIGVLVAHTQARIGEILHSRIFWGGILACGVAILLFAPWLPSFFLQQSQVRESFWIPPIGIGSLPATFYRIYVPTAGTLKYTGFFLIIPVLPILGTILLWLWLVVWCGKKHRGAKQSGTCIDSAWFVAALGITPFLMAAATSLFGRSLYNDRFFAFAGVFIFIAIAHALDMIPKKILRTSCLAVAIVLSLLVYVRYLREINIPGHEGAHAAVSSLYNSSSSSDAVVVSSPFIYFPVLHYAQELFADKPMPHLYSDTGTFSHFSGAPIMTAQDIVGPQQLDAYRGRVVVIDTTGFYQQELVAPKHWIQKKRQVYPEVFVYQGDVVVREFEAL